MHFKPFSGVVLIAIVAASFGSNDDGTVGYYQDLITEGIQQSTVYQFPKDASAYKPTNSEPEDFGTYDFIVIGSGSAGSVIAARLSEIRSWTVLLLEAGEEGNDFTDIPGMSPYVSTSPYNWGFNSTPQDTCCLAMGGVCPFPRGKSLGGTTTINSLVYARGNRADFDLWASRGNPGWSYADVLPYFIKSEDARVNGDAGYHGFGGDLRVEHHVPTSKKVDLFLKANEEAGHPVLDYNGRSQFGAGRAQFNTAKGRRLSSANAFLRTARVRRRPNLKILTGSYATRILISGGGAKAAEGVVFAHGNVLYAAKAGKEVVVSGGVVGSPQLLMLSGVGPRAHLEQLGIPVVADLAVGMDMHDHLTFYNMYFLSAFPEPSYQLPKAVRQFLGGRGPLTISTNPQGTAFYSLNATGSGTADVEVVMVPSIKTAGIDFPARGAVHGHAHPGHAPFWGRATRDDHVFQVVVVLLHPKTRGRVSLSSDDPYAYPLIDSRCLADPRDEDIENVYRGVQKVLRLTETEAFRNLRATLLPVPDCLGHSYLSREYWYCLIRQTAMNAFHGGGTCKMGPRPGEGAVVDSRLKVHGVDRLRVADASVIPVTISGHMSAPSMMVGEKAADLIKAAYGVG